MSGESSPQSISPDISHTKGSADAVAPTAVGVADGELVVGRLERRASEVLSVEPLTDEAKVSPWLSILAQATKSLLSLSRLLRLNPQSRAPQTQPKEIAPVSYYERANLERRHDQD